MPDQSAQSALRLVSDMDEIPVGFLATTGPNGSLLFHSLLDSHPEVLTIPSFLDYYAFYDRHGGLPPAKLAHEFMYRTATISHVFLRHQTRKVGSFELIELDNEVFRRTLETLLSHASRTARSFLLAVHAAYARATRRDLSGVRLLLVHMHYLRPFKRLREDFPSSRFIVAARNPKGTIYSYYRTILENFGKVPSYLILQKLRSQVMSWEWCRTVVFSEGERSYSVRLEDLHSDLNDTISSLAERLGLAVRPELFRSTLGGRDYVLSTSSNDRFSGVNPGVVQPKYKTGMDTQYERFVESFSRGAMRAWSYPLETKADMDVVELASYRFPLEQQYNPLKDFLWYGSKMDPFDGIQRRLPLLAKTLPRKSLRWLAAAHGYPSRMRTYKVYNGYLAQSFFRTRLMRRACVFNRGPPQSWTD